MSTGPLDRETFEAIEAFVIGTMPLHERDVFEQRLRTDAVLRAEVDQQQEHIRAIELGGVQRTLRELGRAQDTTTSHRGSWARFMKYAAVVTLVLGAAAWYALRPTRGERLFAEYYSADPGLPVAMSATHDLAFQDAMVDHKLEDYDAARTKWSRLLQERPTSDTLRYYSAMAAIGAGDMDEAVPLLETVAADRTSSFADNASWYLFLAFIHQGDTARAFALRFDPASRHAADAATIQQAW